jgi:CubicO group peptidase (beta-lactamase class C family)
VWAIVPGWGHTRAFGDADPEWPQPHVVDGRFRIASITKPFTAVLTLRLVQAGKLRLDAPLSEYLPEYRKDVGARVTVEQLLNHTSGIPDFANLPGFWVEELPRPHTREELVTRWMSRDLEFEPGSRARYNSTGFSTCWASSAPEDDVTGGRPPPEVLYCSYNRLLSSSSPPSSPSHTLSTQT